MVGDASKRLQTNHIVDPFRRKGGYLGCYQPAFTELVGQIENFSGLLGDVFNVVKGGIKFEFGLNLINFV